MIDALAQVARCVERRRVGVDDVQARMQDRYRP
jgi:hypothetical protein